MFGSATSPTLDYRLDELPALAGQIVQSQTTVPGVQAKLSMGLLKENGRQEPTKLTIMGVLGGYILKPPTAHYPFLPEIEDLTMHLAEIAGIITVPHALIPMKSGELAYLTKRIDRVGQQKLHMEDMCQLTLRLTEAKYRASYEQVSKAILQYSAAPLLDVTSFMELLVFSFLTGNNDMHLKNFSLLKKPGAGYTLSPAYDLVAAALLVTEDKEELALTLNGKKRKLTYTDFSTAAQNMKIPAKSFESILEKIKNSLDNWHQFIDISFLPAELKQAYHQLLNAREQQLYIA